MGYLPSPVRRRTGSTNKFEDETLTLPEGDEFYHVINRWRSIMTVVICDSVPFQL